MKTLKSGFDCHIYQYKNVLIAVIDVIGGIKYMCIT